MFLYLPTCPIFLSQDGFGTGLKSSNTLLIASHFPPIKDSVFQVTYYILDDFKKNCINAFWL